jgi:hypothetical protein
MFLIIFFFSINIVFSIESVDYYKQKYQLSDEYISEINNIASEIGAKPEAILDVIEFESGFRASVSYGGSDYYSLSESQRASRAVGQIQFTNTAIKEMNQYYPDYNLNKDKLAAMSREEQLEPVGRYFKMWDEKRDIRTTTDVAMAVFAPAKIGGNPNEILYVRGTDSYRLNSGVDLNKDGKISVSEYAQKAFGRNSNDLDFDFDALANDLANSNTLTASVSCLDSVSDVPTLDCMYQERHTVFNLIEADP